MIKEINQAADILPFLEGEPEVFAVCDLNVRWVLEELQAAGLDAPHLFFKASEADKTLSAVEMISRFLMEHHASRNALLLAIGGGITTDVTGLPQAFTSAESAGRISPRRSSRRWMPPSAGKPA